MTTNDYHAVKGICPSPSGEVRWGLKFIRRSNLFLPFGKVRMGYPFGKARMGYPFGKVRMGYPFGKVRMGCSLGLG